MVVQHQREPPTFTLLGMRQLQCERAEPVLAVAEFSSPLLDTPFQRPIQLAQPFLALAERTLGLSPLSHVSARSEDRQ